MSDKEEEKSVSEKATNFDVPGDKNDNEDEPFQMEEEEEKGAHFGREEKVLDPFPENYREELSKNFPWQKINKSSNEEDDAYGSDDPDALPFHAKIRMIERIYKRFEKYEQRPMPEKEFRTGLTDKFYLNFSKEDFEKLVLKMNCNRDRAGITWSEFTSYLLLEYMKEEARSQNIDLELPLIGFPRMIRSRHRFPIVRILYAPSLKLDRTYDWIHGKILTISRDGQINHWNLDMKFEKKVRSRSLNLLVCTTWVTDMAILSDVNMIVTSSTERELRFYDITASQFELRIVITSLEDAVLTMHYYFPLDQNDYSRLIMGDKQGNIIQLSYISYLRGPFIHQPGDDVNSLRWDDLMKGKLKGMNVEIFREKHTNWVRQVAYYISLNYIVSCAACPKASLIMFNTSNSVKFRVNKGITCFCFYEPTHTIVTGSSDCIVRVWSVFIPDSPSVLFAGHHFTIIIIVLQKMGNIIYSIDKEKIIKVWDISKLENIQTYIQLPKDIGEHGIMVHFYNPFSRVFLVGSSKIALMVAWAKIKEDLTDGFTHRRAVSCILYNPLFKLLVSTGLDSTYMVWNPWKNERLLMVDKAHSRMVYGQEEALQITAGCFDPNWQQLVTGATDGSIKIWTFQTGTCIRTMNLPLGCEVTSLMWEPLRILACGWNMRIVEFPDVTGPPEKTMNILTAPNMSKEWELRHSDDILCARRGQQAIATCAYNGEVVLWRLETGQAFKKLHVANPTVRIALWASVGRKGTAKVTRSNLAMLKKKSTDEPRLLRDMVRSSQYRAFNVAKEAAQQVRVKQKEQKNRRKLHAVDSLCLSRALLQNTKQNAVRKRYRLSLADADDDSDETYYSSSSSSSESFTKVETAQSDKVKRKARRVSVIQYPAGEEYIRTLSVHAVVFLKSRPVSPDVGTMIIALENGQVQMWSHHGNGGFLQAFLAIHMAGDHVKSLFSDEMNEYLFTGTTMGYIKIWLLKDFGYIKETIKICMPFYRIEFPFLWRDRFEGRAKRAVRDQPKPLLLSSFRAHLECVTGIIYSLVAKIIISSSYDGTVRLWSKNGQYLGTLGMSKPWPEMSEEGGVDSRHKFRFPPDVERIMSSTTFKVFRGGNVPKTTILSLSEEDRLLQPIAESQRHLCYGKRLTEDEVLGEFWQSNDYNYKPRQSFQIRPKLDISENQIPVYVHLKLPNPDKCKFPKNKIRRGSL